MTSIDVEKKLQMWKNDIRILLESRQEQDINTMENNHQMTTILISMLPDRVAEYSMTKYEVGVTSLRCKSGRKIGQVAS